MLLVVGLTLGLLLGAAAALLFERSRAEEKAAMLEHAREEFSAQIGYKIDALAADALRKNNESFLELAGGKVRPIEESLKKVTEEVQALEESKGGALHAAAP